MYKRQLETRNFLLFDGQNLTNAMRRINDELAGLKALTGVGRRLGAVSYTQLLEIVTATEGDTAESLSRRMVVPHHPLEHFLLLNGLEKARTLKPGEKYKIVTE